MLEVLYDIATKEVRAQNRDIAVMGNLKSGGGQAVIVWDNDSPAYRSAQFYVDLVNETIYGDPLILPAPRDLFEELDEVKAVLANLDNRLTKDVGGHIR